MGRNRIAPLLALSSVVLFLPAVAHSQTAAISLSLDPSVRASGMGRASTAVFWGGDVNYWANPALTGYTNGIQYEYGKAQLVPDLADDVFFTRHRVAMGAYGLGLCFYGEPLSMLGRELDYGSSEARSETGEFLGEFESSENIEGFSFGLNGIELLEALLGLALPSLPRVSRFVDASYGHGWNDVDLDLVPEALAADGQGEGSTKDRGYVVRVTPYESIEEEGYLPALDQFLLSGNLGFRLDGSYGRGEQNYERAVATFVSGSQDTMWTATRTGWAVRLALSASPQARASLRDGGKGWLVDLLHPFLSWGMAWDEEQLEVSVSDPDRPGFRRVPTPATGHGWELSIGNVFSYRRGHYENPDGSFDDATSGWSLGLQYAGLGGFRYDRATTPQAYDADTGEQLADVTHNGFIVFIDPIAVITHLRH